MEDRLQRRVLARACDRRTHRHPAGRLEHDEHHRPHARPARSRTVAARDRRRSGANLHRLCAELELFREDPNPEKALQAIFAKHPLRPHEVLTVNTRYLIDEFLKKIPKLNGRPPDLMSARAAVRLRADRSFAERCNNSLTTRASCTLTRRSSCRRTLAGWTILGCLTPNRYQRRDEMTIPNHARSMRRIARGTSEPIRPAHASAVVIKRSDDGTWSAHALPGGIPIPDDIRLKSSYAKTTGLFNYLKAGDRRVRLVQPIRVDDEDVPVKSLVILAPASVERDKEDEDQPLSDHVGEVENWATRLADSLQLTADDPIRVALLFAARWHDEGKKARIWQVFANNSDPDGTPLGKTAQTRDPKSLCGYRHEFGTLLRIHHPDRHATGCTLPADSEARDLALHLIAAHHGFGRPLFDNRLDRDFQTKQCDAIHTDVIRRFARLQRKYGWWHLAWLENLLRCADQLASADEEAPEIDEFEGGAA